MLRFVIGRQGLAAPNRLPIPSGFSGFSVVDFDPPVESYIFLLYPRKLPSPAAETFLRFIEA